MFRRRVEAMRNVLNTRSKKNFRDKINDFGETPRFSVIWELYFSGGIFCVAMFNFFIQYLK